jgi:phage terminase large subunit
MELKIKASNVFARNAKADTFIVVNQGGTSSGKTYAILQLLLTLALSERLHISVCSLAMPHLRKGALKDWIDILTSAGIYDEQYHNKTDNTFIIGQSKIEFFSLDMPGKARGPRRDILYVNEANLIPLETFRQLLLRTKTKVYIDYNPADEFHWIYDTIIPREDCTFIQSTYLDNPFLPDQIRKEIERLKETDENLWQVYGLGNRGTSRATIYTHWKQAQMMPVSGTDLYGIDFGFNNPTAVVHLRIYDNQIYAEELLYRSGITNSELITLLPSLIPNRNSIIFADAAEPQRIQEIHRAGYNIKPADKSVKDGIDRIRRTPLFFLNSSVNLIKEIKSYKYSEDKDGKILEEPVKLNDHLLDAMRYAWHTYHMKPSGVYALR